MFRLAVKQAQVRSFREINRKIITMPTNRSTSDWNATRYLRYADERTRPARDLLAQVPLRSPARIVDLGCGPGNSTELVATKYPKSELTGVDSSPNMLEKAREQLPDVNFQLNDLQSYSPTGPIDLFFSNATFQWLPSEEQIPVIQRLLKSQPIGGVFALQVPDNLNEPSHAAMRETAANGPWNAVFEARKPARLSFHSPQILYDALKPLCSKVDIWHTVYQHPLENHVAIVDWLKSTGLRPFLEPLNEQQQEGFLGEYLERLRKAYPTSTDGRVLLRFPRLFLVLVRG
ncbi:MAG: hypothetical protein Q9227_003497 [Pyrenula ochraceoflavens]